MSYEPSQEQFLKDVAAHQMRVLRDDGLYRHLEFRGPHGWNHWFEVVTWPNALVIRGDMETWCFSRVEDMFKFFRGERINPHYWQEKLQCARDDAKEFSIDALRQQVIAMLDNWGEDDLPPANRQEVIAELESEIFECYGDHDEHAALEALFNFKYEAFEKHPDYGRIKRGKVTLDPCDGPFGKAWDYHYIWCCWAIVWAIQQYDASKKEKAV